MNPTIKISFNDDVRRIKIDLNQPNAMESILEQVKAAFNLTAERPIVLKYQDEEKELVTLSKAEELLEAARVFTEAGRTLKLFISTTAARAVGDSIAIASTTDDASSYPCPVANQTACSVSAPCGQPPRSCHASACLQDPHHQPEVKDDVSVIKGDKSNHGGCCDTSTAAGARCKCIAIVCCCDCGGRCECCEAKAEPAVKIQCQPSSDATASPQACTPPATATANVKGKAGCGPCSVACGCCNPCSVQLQCVCDDSGHCEPAGQQPPDQPLPATEPKSACCKGARDSLQHSSFGLFNSGHCCKVCVAVC